MIDLSIERPCRKCNLMFTGKECRPCMNARANKFRAENPEIIKERMAAYYQRHAEKIKAAQIEYRKNNVEKVRECSRKNYIENREIRKIEGKKWREENAERCKSISKLWRLQNKEYMSLYQKQYQIINKSRIALARAAYRKANREKCNANDRNKKIKNPELYEAIRKKSYEKIMATPEGRSARKAHVLNRQALKRKSGGKLSKNLASKLLSLQKGMCACCGKRLGNKYHLDHIVPLSRGGPNIDSNIQLLTATCNLQKNAKDPIDFMRTRGFLI